MEKSKSNRKIKNTISIMFMLLICLIAMNITTVSTYAEEKDMNNELQYVKYNPGELHWAGSVDRHGMLFYVVDEKGHIMRDNELCPDKFDKDHEGLPVTFVIGGKEINRWQGAVNAEAYKTHFGNTNIWKFKYVDDSEMPIKWDGSSWETNSDAVKDWLFHQETYNGKSIDMWQFLILTNIDSDIALDVLKALCTNDKLTLVIEPISMSTIYTDNPGTWMVDINTYNNRISELSEVDKKIYFTDPTWCGVERPIPVLLNTNAMGSGSSVGEYFNNSTKGIFRYISTGFISAQFGRDSAALFGQSVPEYGGLNQRWLNNQLPFALTIKEEQLGITPIQAHSKDEVVASHTIANPSLGYSIAMFKNEIKQAKIHSYNILDNPDHADHCELPDPSRNTDGNVTIKKVYYTYKHNSVSFSRTVDAAFETKDCTNSIVIMDEKEKTGYALQNWGTSEGDKLPALTSKFKTLFKVGEDEFVREEKWDKPIFRNGIQKGTSEGTVTLSDNEHYIYLLYCKTEEEPEPEYSDSNWEIPESYLTKSAYFSSAKPTKE